MELQEIANESGIRYNFIVLLAFFLNEWYEKKELMD